MGHPVHLSRGPALDAGGSDLGPSLMPVDHEQSPQGLIQGATSAGMLVAPPGTGWPWRKGRPALSCRGEVAKGWGHGVGQESQWLGGSFSLGVLEFAGELRNGRIAISRGALPEIIALLQRSWSLNAHRLITTHIHHRV